MYPNSGHPNGIEHSPWFNIKSNKLYPAYGHPEGISKSPWYKFEGEKLYPDWGHPEGKSASPWFKKKYKVSITIQEKDDSSNVRNQKHDFETDYDLIHIKRVLNHFMKIFKKNNWNMNHIMDDLLS